MLSPGGRGWASWGPLESNWVGRKARMARMARNITNRENNLLLYAWRFFFCFVILRLLMIFIMHFMFQSSIHCLLIFFIDSHKQL